MSDITTTQMRLRPIPKWPGYYAREDGSIWSSKHGKVRRLKPSRGDGGYLLLSLSNNNKRKNFSVHKLILNTFVGPRKAGMAGAHLNGDPGDCRLENLKWSTYKENEAMKASHGTRLYGEALPSAKLTSNDAVDIRKRHRNGESGNALAREYKVSSKCVHQLINGITWKEALAKPANARE